MLVLDDTENVIQKDLEEFRKFLEGLEAECRKLKVIVTSYLPLNGLKNKSVKKTVHKLSNVHSVKLLLADSPVSVQHAVEFIE